MSTDTNLQIRQYFDQISQGAQEEAERQVAALYESLHLDQLDLNQQIVVLFREIQFVKVPIEGFYGREYCMIHSETLLYKIFSSRLLLYGVNEKEKLQHGCILNRIVQQLTLSYRQRIAQQPPFTYSDFLANKYNVELNELNRQPHGTSDEDYWKILDWQIEKFNECIILESRQLKKRFLSKIDEKKTITDQIDSEIVVLNYLDEFATHSTPKEFMVLFSKLKAFSSNFLPENEHEFQKSFCQYTSSNNLYPTFFNPQIYLSCLENIQAGKISSAPTFYYSLRNYMAWLCDLDEKEPDLTNWPDPDYSEIFETTFEPGKRKSNEMVSEFRNNYPSASLPVEQYKEVILAKMNELRLENRSLMKPSYFYRIINKPGFKNLFIRGCLYNRDFEKEKDNLNQAFAINEMVVFLTNELQRIDKNYFEMASRELKVVFQFTDLISSMAPTSEFLDQLLKAYYKSVNQELNVRSVFFIKEDLKDSLNEIYQQAKTNMRQLFDRLANDKKMPFASYHIKELAYMELNASENGLTLLDHFKRLKRVFEIELDYMKYQSNDQTLDIAQLLQDPVEQFGDDANETKENKRTVEKETSPSKIMAFYYNEIKDDKLAWVHKALLRLKAIPPETTLPELRELVDGQEVVKPLKWLAGQGDLMVFIKEAASNGKLSFPRQQQWKIAVKCFVKADGSKFNANSLKNALPTDKADEFIKAGQKF